MPTLHRRFALALLLSMAPAALPNPAFAQAPAADPTLQAAHARFSEGVAFFDKGEFENARASFLQAYALHKHPAVLINLAQSSLRSGHFLDADRYFVRYVHESTSLTPAQRADAEKGLAEARTKLGRIEVSAAPGTAVMIDGELAGTDGPAALDVEPGAHKVKAGEDTTSVTVVAGQTASVKLGKGGGTVVAATTPTPAEPPVSNPELPPATPPDATPPTPPPTPPPAASTGPGLFSPPATMAPVWIGAGVGVVGFATAIIFGVFKGNAQSSYNNEANAISSAYPKLAYPCSNPPTAEVASACNQVVSDGNAVSSDATVANVGIIAGVVGLGFAAGWYLFAPKAQKSDAPSALVMPHIEPLIGPRLGGLSVGAAF